MSNLNTLKSQYKLYVDKIEERIEELEEERMSKEEEFTLEWCRLSVGKVFICNDGFRDIYFIVEEFKEDEKELHGKKIYVDPSTKDMTVSNDEYHFVGTFYRIYEWYGDMTFKELILSII